MRAALSPHVSIVTDVGGARARSGRWAQLAAGGVLGDWSRSSFEVSASRTDDAFRLLGSVPFAASDRKVATARLRLVDGVMLEGKLSRFQPVGESQRASGKTASSVLLRVDRLARGSLLVHLDRRAELAHDLITEWRNKDRSGATIQWRERHDGSGSQSGRTRRLQVELPNIPTGVSVRQTPY